ncbi:MAG: cellulose synthase subunit BcsC-related outer membrane protein [Burkholderiales bacterium]
MQRALSALMLTLCAAAACGANTAPSGEPGAALQSSLLHELQARDEQALLLQIRFLLGENRPDLARSVLQQLLAVQPDHSRGLLLLGDLELRGRRNDQALALLRRLEARHPDSVDTRQMQSLWQVYTVDRLRLTQLRQLRSMGRLPQARMLARQLFPQGEPPGSLADEFADLYGRAPRAQGGRRVPTPDDPAVQARLLGYAALAGRQHQQAEGHFQNALKRRPNDAASLGGLGIVRLRQSRYAEARRLFDEAAARETGDPREWHELTAVARYWDDVDRARALLDQGQPQAAEALLRPALALQPEQTEARVLLGEALRQTGRLQAADEQFREVLARDPGNARALRGRFAVAMQQAAVAQTPTELNAILTDARAAAARQGVPLADVVDATALRAAADALTAQGHTESAQKLLEWGVAARPADAWLRHDLARLYLRNGLPSLATATMDDGVARAPGDADMRYAAALIALSTDREEDALANLGAIAPSERSDAQRSLAESARFELSLKRYRAALARGDAEAAEAALVEAQGLVRGSPSRQLRVAGAQLGAGQRLRAIALLESIDPAALPPDEALRWAEIGLDAGLVERAGAVLAGLARTQRGTPLQDRIIDAQARLAEQRIESALAAGRPGDARALASDSLSAWTSTTPVPAVAQRAQARLWLAAGEPALALRAIEAQLVADPQDQSTRLLQVQALAAAGRAAEARAAMERLLADRPQDAEVRLEAARLARQDGDYNGAMRHLRAYTAAPSAARAADPAALARVQSAIDDIEARRQPMAELAWWTSSRAGSPGISNLRTREVPFVLRWPVGWASHVFAHVDPVRLDAGTLPVAYADAEAFGQVRALQPPGTPLPQPLPQSANGTNVGIGWEDDRRRIDVGLTGVGMPVTNLVGGWRQSFDQPGMDVTLDVSRRPQTSSLLTYAGAHDPMTGAVWGGVTQTGASLRLGWERPSGNSFSSTWRLGWLDGTHVQRNTVMQWRGVADRDWLRGDSWRLNAGVAAMLWRFQHNSSAATYGQGGYYSPQRYVSLSLPVTLTGRRGDLSYQLRGAVSHSWTHEDAAPYYPLDPALQAAAGNPTVRGGAGGGFGSSLRAAVEWKLSPQWVTGALFDIERSSDYAPNRAMVYLRHFFKPQSEALSVPPRPVVPYSQF